MRDAGYLNYPAPLELILAQIVETWHIPPSVLLQEEADKVLRFWRLNREYEEYYAKRPKFLKQG